MSKKIKVKKDMSSALSAVVIFILAILCFSFLYTFTDNFTAPLKDFYVVCGNDDIMNDRENFDIVKGKTYKFNVVNTLGDGKDDYIVSIVPNQSAVAKFTFKAGETEKSFQDIANLGKGFSLVAHDGYFTLTANKDLSEILQYYYPNDTLSDIPTAFGSGVPYFRLVVKVAGSEQIININFNIAFNDYSATPSKVFHVRCGSDAIMEDRENFDIVMGQSYRFDVVDTSFNGSDAYSVAILPNIIPETAFLFQAGEITGEYHKLIGEHIPNLNKGFSIASYDGYFILTANMDLSDIIQEYTSQEISGVPTTLNSGIPYYCLAVQDIGSGKTININFNLVSE